MMELSALLCSASEDWDDMEEEKKSRTSSSASHPATTSSPQRSQQSQLHFPPLPSSVPHSQAQTQPTSSVPAVSASQKKLRKLELDAYVSVLCAFWCSGELSWEKENMLMDLRQVLHISDVRHRSELTRIQSAPVPALQARHNKPSHPNGHYSRSQIGDEDSERKERKGKPPGPPPKKGAPKKKAAAKGKPGPKPKNKNLKPAEQVKVEVNEPNTADDNPEPAQPAHKKRKTGGEGEEPRASAELNLLQEREKLRRELEMIEEEGGEEDDSKDDSDREEGGKELDIAELSGDDDDDS